MSENYVLNTNDRYRNFMGLFSMVNNMVGTIYHFKKTGKQPNLFYDISKNTSYYHEGYTETDNVWEYYFHQPCGIPYSEINNGLRTHYNPFFVRDNMPARLHYPTNNIEAIRGELSEINRLVFLEGKNTIKLKDHVKQKIQDVEEELGLNESKYISVHFRYFKVENPNHFGDGHTGDRPEFDVWFNEIDKILTDEHKIYLTTDDDISLEAFKKKYGDRLVYSEYVDRTFTRDIENSGFNPANGDMGKFVKEIIYGDRTKNPYEIGLDAIVDTYLLSKGETIIRNCSGLSFYSIILNPQINIINIDNL